MGRMFYGGRWTWANNTTLIIYACKQYRCVNWHFILINCHNQNCEFIIWVHTIWSVSVRFSCDNFFLYFVVRHLIAINDMEFRLFYLYIFLMALDGASTKNLMSMINNKQDCRKKNSFYIYRNSFVSHYCVFSFNIPFKFTFSHKHFGLDLCS